MSNSEVKRAKVDEQEKVKVGSISHASVTKWCSENGYVLVKKKALPCGGHCHDPRPTVGWGHSGDPHLMCATCDPKCRDCGEPVGCDYAQDDEGPQCYRCLM